MKNRFSLLTVLTVAMAPIALASASLFPVSAISAMSMTGTGITANSSTISTGITPTINYTPGVALVTDGDTIEITLNGTAVVSGQTLEVADLTLTGCTENTLEAAPGTGDNGAHEVTITNGASTNTNPVILITLDSSAGPTAPDCDTSAKTLAIDLGQLESSGTAGNYVININTTEESGAFFYYVGDENDVQIEAVVEPVLTFNIVTSSDTTTNQPNVGGGAVGPNLCDLGNLSSAGVQTCDYRLFVATNAASGYTVNIETDGSLRKGTDFIDNVSEGSTVTGGTEGYGIALNAGASTEGGVTITEAGDFSDDDTPTASGLSSGINTTLYSSDGPNDPDPGVHDATNTALVTHRAEASAATAAGTYVQLVTYTVSASY